MMPVPKNINKLEFTVKRDKSGFTKTFYPRYYLTTGNGRSILAAESMNAVGSAHYEITMNFEDTVKKIYLGKLRSSVPKDEFDLFGPGESPSKKLRPEEIRNQFASILYVRFYQFIGTVLQGWEYSSEDEYIDTKSKEGRNSSTMEANDQRRTLDPRI
eukprot:TRINITY_DN13788_c0_g1_i4.p1 TRINITY_DN13788_c0_g1~~TRINITY_DN13788_c0_g1_i4.p1  ORF type:complete len:158 (+),score=20.24 TRINITY_DN13788_c0_g1_i4:386-859(+)